MAHATGVNSLTGSDESEGVADATGVDLATPASPDARGENSPPLGLATRRLRPADAGNADHVAELVEKRVNVAAVDDDETILIIAP